VSPVASSLLSVVGVSLLSLVGLLTLGVREERVRRLTTHFISFATGGLLGDAFIHLVPTSFSKPGPALPRSLALLGGLMVFFVVEKVLRHDHGPMLGTVGPGQLPCALVRKGDRYVLHADSRARVVDDKIARTIGPTAYVFYTPFPVAQPGAWDLLRFGVRERLRPRRCRRPIGCASHGGEAEQRDQLSIPRHRLPPRIGTTLSTC
jgi:zinc transporter ZupT